MRTSWYPGLTTLETIGPEPTTAPSMRIRAKEGAVTSSSPNPGGTSAPGGISSRSVGGSFAADDEGDVEEAAEPVTPVTGRGRAAGGGVAGVAGAEEAYVAAEGTRESAGGIDEPDDALALALG